MNILDIILIVILFLFFWMGFWRGLVKTLGGFVGAIVGIFIAGVFYSDLSAFIIKYISISEKVLNVIAFILIVIITAWIVDFILKRIFAFVSIVPFVKTINRIAGGAFGLLQGVLILGFAIYIYSKFSFWEALDVQIIDSQVAPALVFLIKFAISLLPSAIKEIEGLI